jgi:transcription elongation factor GreA
MTQIILTPDGKIKIENELRDLKGNQLPSIIDKIAQAKELGDLSENAEYHAAKDEQGMIVARIAEIEEILKKAVITTGEIDYSGKIGIGNTFVVEDVSGKHRELTIVGFNEADPIAGKISNDSPMGQAFIGKKEGSTVEVEAPRGTIVFKVIKIN